MIVITVEHLPGGDARRKTVIGRATISNDETGSEELGNYHAHFWEWRKPGMGLVRRSHVLQFERMVYGVWDLVRVALSDAKKAGEEIQF